MSTGRLSWRISVPNIRPILPCITLKMCGNTKFDPFDPSQNCPKNRKINKLWKTYFWILQARIHQHTNLRPFPPCILHKLCRNVKFYAFLLVIVAEIKRKWTEVELFLEVDRVIKIWRWSEYIGNPDFKRFLQCIFIGKPWNLSRWRMDVMMNGEISSNVIFPSDFVGGDN